MTKVIDKQLLTPTTAKLICEVQQCASDSLYLNPDVRVIICDAAAKWISSLASHVLEANERWIDPAVTDNDDNQIVFEWWHVNRKLTARVGIHSVDLIRRWGNRSDRRREELQSPSIEQVIEWWSWFTNDAE